MECPKCHKELDWTPEGKKKHKDMKEARECLFKSLNVKPGRKIVFDRDIERDERMRGI